MKTISSLFFLSAFIIFILAGCSGGSRADGTTDLPEHLRDIENLSVYPADSEPTHSIDFVPVQTFGDLDEPLLGTIGGAIVDDRNRVLLWDRSGQSSRLHVFNPDGSYHTQIGRSGQGPGEYDYIRGLFSKAGKIFLHDASAGRVNIYSAEDYSFMESFVPQQWDVMDQEIVSNLRFSEFHIRSDGNILVSFTGSPTPENEPIPQKLVMVNSNGSMIGNNVIESSSTNMFMHSQEGALFMLPLQFQGETRQALSKDDEIYLTSSSDFLIEKYDAEGKYESAIYYPVSKAPFDADSFFEGRFSSFGFDARGEIESAIGLPEFWPALEQLWVDDENRIWVATVVDDLERYEWWVLQESGELLAKFTWPRDRRIQDIKNGYLYSRESDEETGLQTVEKYRIQLTEA